MVSIITQALSLPVDKWHLEINSVHLFSSRGKKGPTCLSTFTNFPIMLWSSISAVDDLATNGSFLRKSQQFYEVIVSVSALQDHFGWVDHGPQICQAHSHTNTCWQ